MRNGQLNYIDLKREYSHLDAKTAMMFIMRRRVEQEGNACLYMTDSYIENTIENIQDYLNKL